ncbi:MAG: cobalamin B12-binding domain-containing protein [Desulfobacteraceae bacterium]|nr:cobalamin B12-binding domain-containing protein [Desulfobacteraceae bacterium]
MKGKRKIRVLVSKTGLDGHDRGIKVVALALKNAGIEVVYMGRHQTPEQVVNTALQEDVDFIGVSNLSGSYKELLTMIIRLLEEKNIRDMKLLLGGIIADEDLPILEKMNVTVFQTGCKMQEIVDHIKANV